MILPHPPTIPGTKCLHTQAPMLSHWVGLCWFGWLLVLGIVYAPAVLAKPLGNSTPSKQPAFPPVLPPFIKIDILDAKGNISAKALVYYRFIEILTPEEKKIGSVGIVWAKNRWQLFLVGVNNQRSLLGWSSRRQLFNAKGELVAIYAWTPVWSFIYDAKRRRLGRAKCLAFQGICAAGAAGWLAGLFPQSVAISPLNATNGNNTANP